MLQFVIMSKNTRELYLPTGIQKMSINPELHKQIGDSIVEGCGIPVYNYQHIKIAKSGGVELKGMKASLAPKRQQQQSDPVYQRYTFVPYENDRPLVEDPEKARFHAVHVMLNIARMNLGVGKLNVVELAGERAPEAILLPSVVEILEMEPLISVS